MSEKLNTEELIDALDELLQLRRAKQEASFDIDTAKAQLEEATERFERLLAEFAVSVKKFDDEILDGGWEK